MKYSDIIEIINQGENSAVEFKSADVKPDSIAKEIIAFANMNGGEILIGVEDNKTISGISTDRNWEEWIMNIARNNINPPLSVDFKYIELEKKTIACISVAKGTDKPYQTSDGKYYIRVGSTNRIASQNELNRLFQQAGLIHYDTMPVEGTSIDDLHAIKLSEYWNLHYQLNYNKLNLSEQINLLKNAQILKSHESTFCATIAGLLIFGTNPQQYLPHTEIVFAVYKGKQINDELLHKKSIYGTLSELIDNTKALFETFIPRPSKIVETKRNEQIAASGWALREIIVNAICHRDYSRINRRIHAYKFDDRIEVVSPGKLPNGLTMENIKVGNSGPRNMLILKFLDNLRYIDGLGRGIPMLIHEFKDKISFEEIGEEFKVTLEL